MPSTIIYTSTVADDRASTILNIRPDGTGDLIIGSNRDRRTQPVGRFAAPVPESLLAPLRSLTASPEFAAVTGSTDLLPGDPYRQIRVIANGRDVAKTVGTGPGQPAAFLQAEQAALAILQHLLQHPALAMTMTVSGLPERVGPGGAHLDVNLYNVGRMPFFMSAPPLWGKAQTNCELSAVRDVPEAQLTLADQKFASLGGSELVGASKPAEGELLSMRPGEGVAVRFRYPFQWPPGAYRVEVTLSVTLSGADGAPLFDGNLIAGPYRIEVAAR